MKTYKYCVIVAMILDCITKKKLRDLTISYFRKTSLFCLREENFLGLPSRNLIEAKNTRFPLSVIIVGLIFYFHNYGAFFLVPVI